ncbi:MAG: PaaI family thioesterase [Desulfobacterales bacterium]
MKKPNPAYIEQLNRIVSESPYFSLLSMKMVDIGIGFSLFEMDVDRKHFHPFGFTHGGVFASIIDSAAFWAMHFDLDDPDSRMISVDLKLNFLAPAASGKLIARGRRIKHGKTLGYAEAEVTDEKGKILAHGTSTLMTLYDKGIFDKRSLPDKFLT